jgi:uncharacterized protein (TIRG00374 family)
MARSLRHALALLAGIAISVTFLLFALRGVRWSDAAAALRSANYWYCVVVVATYLATFWIKSARLAYLLTPVRATSAREVLPAFCAGNLGNLVFPAYLGEAARVALLARELKLSPFSLISALIVERLCDFVTLLALIGAVMIMLGRLDSDLEHVAEIIGVLALVTTLAIVALLFVADRMPAAWREASGARGARLRSALIHALDKAVAGLKATSSPRLLLGAVLTSILSWAVMGACTYASFLAFDIHVPLHAAFVVILLVSAAMTLPSAPGWIGAVQLGFTLGLAPYGVAAADAFATSLVFHATIYATALITGLVFLHRIGWRLFELRAQAAAAEPARDGKATG